MSKQPNLVKDVEKFVDELEKEGGKPLYDMTPEEAREFIISVQQKHPLQIEADVFDTNIFTETVDNVDVRIVRPLNNNEKLPVIIYAHGGGWVIGDKEVYDTLIKRLSTCANAAVFFVNYNRSPEDCYPTALNQIYGVMDYVYNHPAEFNVDSEKMVIAGDSAGANLAAAAALKAKDENGPKILCQILLYPVTDSKMDTKSYDKFKKGPWLTKKAMEYFWDSYEPDKKLREEKYLSMLRVSEDDLRGLPPALVITAENDVLRDEGEEFARKLDEADVKAVNVRINGTIHDFMMLNALADTMPTKIAFTIVCAKLKKMFNN